MDTTQIANVLTDLVRLMVDRPNDVSIEIIRDSAVVQFRITVSSADIGKLIGRQGRTAHSLRVILQAIGMKSKSRISLDLLET